MKPFGVETLDPCGPSTRFFFKEILKRLIDTSRDPWAGLFLGQRIKHCHPTLQYCSTVKLYRKEEYFDT